MKKESDESAKKAAIQAAMERAKAKREAAGTQPKNTENLTEAQRQQIAEAEARRESAKASAPAGSVTEAQENEE